MITRSRLWRRGCGLVRGSLEGVAGVKHDAVDCYETRRLQNIVVDLRGGRLHRQGGLSSEFDVADVKWRTVYGGYTAPLMMAAASFLGRFC